MNFVIVLYWSIWRMTNIHKQIKLLYTTTLLPLQRYQVIIIITFLHCSTNTSKKCWELPFIIRRRTHNYAHIACLLVGSHVDELSSVVVAVK